MIKNVSAPVENNELMQKEFERWSRDEAAYRINHNPMSGFACSKYGFEAGYKAALSLESKQGDNDSELKLKNLKMLVMQLARKHPNEKLAAGAIDYLHRSGLITPLDILRCVEPPTTSPEIAEDK